MLNIYFIAGHGENFRRMPEFLAGEDVRITLICCSTSLLRKSQFIDEVITVTKHPDCANFVRNLLQRKDLLSKIDGWVIFASDDDLYKVAHSDLELALKLKLLPIRNLHSFNLVGSKAEFINTCTASEVPIPKSAVVTEYEQMTQIANDFSLPFVIKSDQGSSGAGVRVINHQSELATNPVPDSWYPLVIQEFVTGEPRGVDAFFREGHLLAWMYSGFFEFTTEFGPSTSRRYMDPPYEDFVESLQRYGKATGANGFANCSFFYVAEENKHLAFEIDLRTNAWHHLGRMFGLDWHKMMTKPLEEIATNVQYPMELPEEGLVLTHWQRHIEFAIHTRDWSTTMQLLRIPKNERFPIVYKDEALNRAQIRGLIQLAIIAVAQSFFELLPIKLQKSLKDSGATARFASRVASR